MSIEASCSLAESLEETHEEYSKLGIEELRANCLKKGLPGDGEKTALVLRLCLFSLTLRSSDAHRQARVANALINMARISLGNMPNREEKSERIDDTSNPDTRKRKAVSWHSDVRTPQKENCCVPSESSYRRPATPSTKKRRFSTASSPSSATKDGSNERRKSAPSLIALSRPATPGKALALAEDGSLIAEAKAEDEDALGLWQAQNSGFSASNSNVRFVLLGDLGKQSALAAHSIDNDGGGGTSITPSCQAAVYCPKASLTGAKEIERALFAADAVHDITQRSIVFDRQVAPALEDLVRNGGSGELLLCTIGDKNTGKTSFAFGNNRGRGPFRNEDDLGVFSHHAPMEVLQLVRSTYDLRDALVSISFVRVEVLKSGGRERLVDLLATPNSANTRNSFCSSFSTATPPPLTCVGSIEEATSVPFVDAGSICQRIEDANVESFDEKDRVVASAIIVKVVVCLSGQSICTSDPPHCSLIMVDSFFPSSSYLKGLFEANARNSSGKAVLVGCTDSSPSNAQKCITSIRSMLSITNGYRRSSSKELKGFTKTPTKRPSTAGAGMSPRRSSIGEQRPHSARRASRCRDTPISITPGRRAS